VLYKEIELIGVIIGSKARITQLHLGGGSPSMLKPEDLAKLKASLQQNFNFSNDTQISIELDPSDIDENIMSGLSQFGMTRASIGVQDFAEDVQKAINRPQTFEDTKYVVNALRKSGINSLNIDALYGLPLQTQSGLLDTLRQVISLDPDRIALFGYAHVPWMKKHQQLILEKDIPGLDERFAQARLAEKYLTNNGYLQIGIDHFAKPSDTLAISAASKTMKRNFQGYTTDDSQYLIGLGASSIGQTPEGFIQNTHATASYMRQVENGEIPVTRGLILTAEDKMRGAVIEQLMCYFEIRNNWLDAELGNCADKIRELARELVMLNKEGYFIETENGFAITQDGKPFTRQFAAHFDVYLNQGTARHSVAI
jgi:oxygen-independent coproporphyrinogen-3 oxidase